MAEYHILCVEIPISAFLARYRKNELDIAYSGHVERDCVSGGDVQCALEWRLRGVVRDFELENDTGNGLRYVAVRLAWFKMTQNLRHGAGSTTSTHRQKKIAER